MELDILLQKIDELLSAVYQTDTRIFTNIFTIELSHELSTAIQQSLEEEKLSLNRPQELQEFLTSLKSTLQQTHLLTLTLAYGPSDQDISLYAAKAKMLFGMNTVLELSVQENILGGAIVVYKGKYMDYSLKTRLNEVFKTRSKDILALLNTIRNEE
jgi:F0F1-type ATP synthase delta subunit